MSQPSDEERERATAVMHVVSAAFPTEHLAPWEGVLDRGQVHSVVGLKWIGKVGVELDRRAWMTNHPDEPLPRELQDPDEENHKGEPEFDFSKQRGAVNMYSYGLWALADLLHDYSPSTGGLGRKQAILVATSQRTGQSAAAIEPHPRSTWDKIRGKNKQSDLAGMG